MEADEGEEAKDEFKAESESRYIRMQVAVHGTESLNLDQVIFNFVVRLQREVALSMVRFKVNINLIAHPIN
jgi:hypothetical protein